MQQRSHLDLHCRRRPNRRCRNVDILKSLFHWWSLGMLWAQRTSFWSIHSIAFDSKFFLLRSHQSDWSKFSQIWLDRSWQKSICRCTWWRLSFGWMRKYRPAIIFHWLNYHFRNSYWNICGTYRHFYVQYVIFQEQNLPFWFFHKNVSFSIQKTTWTDWERESKCAQHCCFGLTVNAGPGHTFWVNELPYAISLTSWYAYNDRDRFTFSCFICKAKSRRPD